MLTSFASGRLFGAVHGSGPPSVLALPGWARTHRDFDATLRGLDAVALDLPGFGATPPPAEAMGAAGYAEAVAAVLDEVGAPVVVLGHSFGGRVAVHLAAAHAPRVRGLVLTGVPLVRVGGRARRPPPAFRLARALHRLGVVGDARMEALRRRFGSADYRHAEEVMRAVLVRVVHESYEEQLGAVTCPAELVWGDDDAEVPVAVAEAALALLPGATLTTVAGAGHLTPLTAPGAVRAAIERLSR